MTTWRVYEQAPSCLVEKGLGLRGRRDVQGEGSSGRGQTLIALEDNLI